MNKFENRLTYILLVLSIFLLNYNNLSLLSIILGSIITIPVILLFENI